MDINYFMKIQNAYGTQGRRDKELIKTNSQMSKHFQDTFDTEDVVINGMPTQLMIIKDTEGNTFKKKIKSKHGDQFNLGDYVEWNGQIWLVTLVDVDEKTWNRGYMYLCTVPLRWQNADGEIVERYAYAEDFTKYSSGVTGNGTITIGDNQYGLTLPVDSETKKLKRDMRFPIDFDDSEQPDIYMLTNRKVKLSDNQYFGRGGTMIVTMSVVAFNKNDDKKVTIEDGREIWICNYNGSHTPLPPQSSNEMTDLTVLIYGNTSLRNGHSRTYTASFQDKKGNAIKYGSGEFEWKITSDFEVEHNIYGDKIDLKVNDESLIDSSFLLAITVNGNTAAEIRINIVE